MTFRCAALPVCYFRKRGDHMIIFDHVSKVYPNGTVGLDDVDLTIQDGEFVAIIGRSGAGKSTLLRCMNLLETPSSGEIRYHGTNIMDKHVNVPEYRSKVGMVFQNLSLIHISEPTRRS